MGVSSASRLMVALGRAPNELPGAEKTSGVRFAFSPTPERDGLPLGRSPF